jgi:DNA-binding transcriptional LysR family regulator
MSPAFAVRWFMPRIMDFQQRHPGITLMLNPTADVVELKPGGIDLAIRYGDARGPETKVDALVTADMVVVGTPALIGDQDITDPARLAEVPWLQEYGTNEVADWMARHGVTPERPLMITHMPGNLIMEAVRRGDGITYTARPWVEDELRSGALIELFSDRAFGTYYIVTRPGMLRPPVKAFVKWLKQQAATETTSRI